MQGGVQHIFVRQSAVVPFAEVTADASGTSLDVYKRQEYKILIVDDVMSNVLLLKVLLTNEKFAIATASNGRQALEQVEKENPDLVLIDVMMPDMSGFEVAQHLKSNPQTAEIPIIFLTARCV